MISIGKPQKLIATAYAHGTTRFVIQIAKCDATAISCIDASHIAQYRSAAIASR